MVFGLKRTVYVFCQNDRRLAGICESTPRTQARSGQSQTRVRPTPHMPGLLYNHVGSPGPGQPSSKDMAGLP